MTTKKTLEKPEIIISNPRLDQIIRMYTLGQQEYNGVKDYPDLERHDFENEVQLFIYKQGFEDAVYDQSFRLELDNPEFLKSLDGFVFKGWTLRDREYIGEIEKPYWTLRWTSNLGQTGRTNIAADAT